MRKQRKNYTGQEKVFILKRHLVDQVAVSELCDEEDRYHATAIDTPRLLGRKVKETGDHFELNEQEAACHSHLVLENSPLSLENMFLLGVE